MKVFSLYFKILRHEKGAVLAYILGFIAIFSLISSSIQSSLQEEEVQDYSPSVAIFDHDETRLSQELSEYLFTNTKKVELASEDAETLKDALYSQLADYILVIPEGFTQSLEKEGQQLMLKTYVSSQSSLAEKVDMMLEGFIRNWDLIRWSMGGDPQGADLDLAFTRLAEVLTSEVHGKVIGEEATDAIFGVRIYLCYLGYILTAVGFNIIGMPIVTVEDPLMKRRDVVSGFSEVRRTSQLFAASYLTMCVVWFVMVFYSFTQLGFHNLAGRSVRLMLLSSFIHTLAIASFVLLICHVFPKKTSVGFLATLLSLLLAFSSGVFVPKEMLWPPFHKFSALFPTYWEVNNQNNVQALLAAGSSLQPYYTNLLVMAGMGVLYFTLTLLHRRVKARSSIQE